MSAISAIEGTLAAHRGTDPAPDSPPSPLHSIAAPPSADSTTYLVRRWPAVHGLSQISGLAKDEVGHLWIGTTGGLTRFDGYSFTRFNAATTPGLPSNTILALELSSEGRLWIATEKGLAIRDDGQFMSLSGKARLTSMDAVPGGTIWAAGRGGLYRASDTSATQIPLPDSLNDHRVGNVEGMSSDSAWVAVDSYLLLYHDGTFTRPFSLAEGQEKILGLQKKGGPLWVTLTNHLASIDNGKVTRYSFDIGRVHAFRIAPSGAVWMNTNQNGLFRFADSSLHRVQTESPLPENLNVLLQDDVGQWWIGTKSKGLIRLRPRLFHHVDEAPTSSPAVRSVYADNQRTVWAGASPDGILQIDGSTVSTVPLPPSQQGHSVWSIIRDQTGAVWATTPSALLRRREEKFEEVRTIDGASVRRARVLHRDSTGSVWVGTDQMGVYRYRNDSLQQLLTAERLSASIRALHQTNEGTFWVGTVSKGVAQYHEGSLTWYDTDDGVPHAHVSDVYETSDGALWIATHGAGIARFEGNHFTAVTTEEGLPSDTIHTLREAPSGTFWMTSNNGVVRVSRSQVEAVAAGRRDHLYTQTFDEDDGMPTPECTGNVQPAITQDPSGRLWIPTRKGLTTVDPQDPWLTAPNSIPLRVTEVRANGTPQPLDSLRLDPFTSRVTLDFSAVSLQHADDLSFRYRLDDKAWTPARGRLSAEFTTLDAGPHLFEVQATLNGETWYTFDRPLRFTIIPRFYETGWFRLLVALGVFGLIGAVYAWRTRALRRRKEKLQRLVNERTERLAEEKRKTEAQAERLEAIDEEKSRFFANISHELRTPLTILQGTLQDLLDGAFGDVPPPVQRQHELMQSNVDQLHRLTEQLLDLARLDTTEPELDREPVDLVAHLRRLTRSYIPLAERRGVTLQLDTTVDEQCGRLDFEKVDKIVGNLLTNALENTSEGGTVRVCLDVEEGDPPQAVLCVVDTGRGIPPGKQDELFERFAHAEAPTSDREGTGIGLALAREYAELHGGTIALDSTPGEGSTFTVRLPLPPAAPDGVDSEEEPERTAAPPIAPMDAASSPSGDGVPADDDGPLLLLVEDNADVRAYLRRHLSDTYRIVEAADGAEGLTKAQETTPDLILADLMMPEMGGIELCRRIRGEEALREVPILMLTARAAEEDAINGLEAGADAYVTKPFSVDVLTARLERLRATSRTGDAREEPALLRPEVDVSSADEEFLDRVVDTIEAHLSHADFTVEDLSANVGISPRQLHRKMKRLTDKTPAEFIRTYRLTVARQLLEEEAGTVAEVAYEVGFGTPETFAKHFKDRFGCPPSAYPEEAPPATA